MGISYRTQESRRGADRSGPPFRDRRAAGRALAEDLATLPLHDPVLLALPRGGVPVAAEVAAAEGWSLDVLVVRKLGHPRNPELAIGAVAEGGEVVLDEDLARDVAPEAVERARVRESAELERRVATYRDGRDGASVEGREVVVVDDGLATGSTAAVAVALLRRRGARRIVVAAPVAAPGAVRRLAALADDVVVIAMPERFRAVGEWYDDFHQVSDDEVVDLLRSGTGSVPTIRSQEIAIPVGAVELRATVVRPEARRGTVVFSHGSGSSRHSPRNRSVARRLARSGFTAVLADLLTEEEAGARSAVFDIGRLAHRVEAVVAWAEAEELPQPLALFGASTGAAAALVAAARLQGRVAAVVSRGGRPDLAGASLAQVSAPTLLIVGGDDHEVLRLNRRAAERMTRCDHLLTVVPHATHLFEEHGALEAVADQTVAWLAAHLDEPSPPS